MPMRYAKRVLMGLGIGVLIALMAGCSDLAGEPEIVGQLPPRNPQASTSADAQPQAQAPDMAQAQTLYAENCVRCHGVSGAGDGEFVQSGQIASIPDFTDPAQHAERTPDDYYQQITDGNLAQLMPPFGASLSDEQRWSLAHYLFTLADDAAVTEAQADPHAGLNLRGDAGDTAADMPNVDDADVDAQRGTISGTVLHGTAGAQVEQGTIITLHIVEMTHDRHRYETALAADGTYQFTDVPIIPDSGYFVSMAYGDGTYNSQFAMLTPDNPALTLDLTVYETTNDDSVIHVNMLLTQIDVVDDATLRIAQMISVTNNSDRLYVDRGADGQDVSVRLPLPDGVQLAAGNNMSRFMLADGVLYDTRPVLPGADHRFTVTYTAPFDRRLVFSQSFPYPFVGSYEAYVDSALLRLESATAQTLNPQTSNGKTYAGIAYTSGFSPSAPITYTIARPGASFALSQQGIGYAILGVGLVLIVLAAGVYWFTARPPVADDPDPVTGILRQMATLDDRYERGEIDRTTYEQQRQRLKAQVAEMMQA